MRSCAPFRWPRARPPRRRCRRYSARWPTRRSSIASPISISRTPATRRAPRPTPTTRARWPAQRAERGRPARRDQDLHRYEQSPYQGRAAARVDAIAAQADTAHQELDEDKKILTDADKLVAAHPARRRAGLGVAQASFGAPNTRTSRPSSPTPMRSLRSRQAGGAAFAKLGACLAKSSDAAQRAPAPRGNGAGGEHRSGARHRPRRRQARPRRLARRAHGSATRSPGARRRCGGRVRRGEGGARTAGGASLLGPLALAARTPEERAQASSSARGSTRAVRTWRRAQAVLAMASCARRANDEQLQAHVAAIDLLGDHDALCLHAMAIAKTVSTFVRDSTSTTWWPLEFRSHLPGRAEIVTALASRRARHSNRPRPSWAQPLAERRRTSKASPSSCAPRARRESQRRARVFVRCATSSPPSAP